MRVVIDLALEEPQDRRLGLNLRSASARRGRRCSPRSSTAQIFCFSPSLTIILTPRIAGLGAFDDGDRGLGIGLGVQILLELGARLLDGVGIERITDLQARLLGQGFLALAAAVNAARGGSCGRSTTWKMMTMPPSGVRS